MDAKEELKDCLQFFNIEMESDEGNKVYLQKGYCIEVEANGLYKLMQHGEVIAPFDDLNELCHFILSY
jgi:hypothetical protein